MQSAKQVHIWQVPAGRALLVPSFSKTSKTDTADQVFAERKQKRIVNQKELVIPKTRSLRAAKIPPNRLPKGTT